MKPSGDVIKSPMKETTANIPNSGDQSIACKDSVVGTLCPVQTTPSLEVCIYGEVHDTTTNKLNSSDHTISYKKLGLLLTYSQSKPFAEDIIVSLNVFSLIAINKFNSGAYTTLVHNPDDAVLPVQLELELELIQTQMAQKPMLRAEVNAHAMRASQNRKKEVRGEKEV